MLATLRRRFSVRILAAAAAGALAGLLLLAVVLIWRGAGDDTLVLEVSGADDPNVMTVYVGGQVAQPGLYELPRGSRVAEAIDAAGGATSTGDTSALGMAALLDDAEQVIVPARATPVPFSGPAPQATRPAEGGSGGSQPNAVGSSPTTPSDAPAASPININVATTTELESLPRIGPAIAARIIEYRQANGPFQNVDELVEIRGISPAMVDELRPHVSVGP